MNIFFTKAGKYKNDNSTLEIKESDVVSEKMFSVVEGNARSFIKAGLAKLAEKLEKDREKPDFDDDPGTDIDKMTVPQLKAFADGLEPIIDLGDAKTKAEKLEIIRTEIDIRKAALEAEKED